MAGTPAALLDHKVIWKVKTLLEDMGTEQGCQDLQSHEQTPDQLLSREPETSLYHIKANIT